MNPKRQRRWAQTGPSKAVRLWCKQVDKIIAYIVKLHEIPSVHGSEWTLGQVRYYMNRWEDFKRVAPPGTQEYIDKYQKRLDALK